MTGLLDADVSFPSFTGQESESEKTDKMLNYLYMLLENLRYTLGNLDAENFNDNGLEEIGKIFTDPLYARIESQEGALSEISLTAEALSLRISDAESDISQLYMDHNSISLSVSNYGSFSTIKLTGNGISSSAQQISFTGFVTFSDLKGSGNTTINGDNIVSGTITGTTFKSVYNENGVKGSFQCYYYNQKAGEIYAYYNTPSTGNYVPAIYIAANGQNNSALKLTSNGGTSIESKATVFIASGGYESITVRSDYCLYLQASDSYDNIIVGYVDAYGNIENKTLKAYIQGVVAGTI